MTVIVPQGDSAHYALYNDITTLTTAINNATNGKQKFELTKLQAAKQLALVQSLIANGNILASAVLSTMTYSNSNGIPH